ncbi:MAG: alpha/beta hydrolase [Candidatus Omnitrophota bacterium]
MSSITCKNNVKWHYEMTGSGDPIIFIHGFGGSCRWWWRQKVSFERDYQVLTFDLPGHGQSSWETVSLQEIAAGIRQILGDLNLETINVVASSFGGLVAIELYRLIPEQISRISFVGALPKFARNDSYPAGLDIDKIRTLGEQFEGDYGLVLDIFFRSLFTKQERESPSFKELKDLRQSERLPNREALKAFLDMLEKVDLRDRLSSIVCPVQFITGTKDYICPTAVMEWVQEHMPNARLDFIDGCGHLPFLTQAEKYNDLVENFLIN